MASLSKLIQSNVEYCFLLQTELAGNVFDREILRWCTIPPRSYTSMQAVYMKIKINQAVKILPSAIAWPSVEFTAIVAPVLHNRTVSMCTEKAAGCTGTGNIAACIWLGRKLALPVLLSLLVSVLLLLLLLPLLTLLPLSPVVPLLLPTRLLILVLSRMQPLMPSLTVIIIRHLIDPTPIGNESASSWQIKKTTVYIAVVFCINYCTETNALIV